MQGFFNGGEMKFVRPCVPVLYLKKSIFGRTVIFYSCFNLNVF